MPVEQIGKKPARGLFSVSSFRVSWDISHQRFRKGGALLLPFAHCFRGSPF